LYPSWFPNNLDKGRKDKRKWKPPVSNSNPQPLQVLGILNNANVNKDGSRSASASFIPGEDEFDERKTDDDGNFPYWAWKLLHEEGDE